MAQPSVVTRTSLVQEVHEGSRMARVLLVDDDRDMLDALGIWLRRDHVVQLAPGLPEALAAFAAGPPPEVLITDFDLPPFCGDDLLAMVAEQYPRVHRILHTGTAKAKLRGAAALAHRVLDKGCEPEELRRAINDCLGRQCLSRARQ